MPDGRPCHPESRAALRPVAAPATTTTDYSSGNHRRVVNGDRLTKDAMNGQRVLRADEHVLKSSPYLRGVWRRRDQP